MTPSPVKTLPQVLIITPQGERNYLFPPSSVFENLLPPTAERLGGNYYFLYQNSIKKHEDNLEN